MIGAHELADLCLEIEMVGKNGEQEKITQLAAQIDSSIKVVVDFIKEYTKCEHTTFS